MQRLRRYFAVGSAANEQLTALVAAALLFLLAVEGATVLRIQSLLTVHAFVGMLLIPVVALKFASTGWRALRYYRGAEDYVRRGPPHLALRAFVAPVVALSTLTLFGTGVALLALDQTHGTIVGLHKASFIVWFGATGIHVLSHVWKLPRLLGQRLPGFGARMVLVCATVAAGALVAVSTLPSVDRLQDRATGAVAIDRR